MTAGVRVLVVAAIACGQTSGPSISHPPSKIQWPAQRRATLHGDGSVAVASAYSRSGHHVAIVGATGAVRVWDVTTGAQVGMLPDGGELVAAGIDDTFILYHLGRWTFTVWNWRTATVRHFSAYDALEAFGPTADAAGVLATISHVAVSPDGTRLLTTDTHATGLVLWNLATGTPRRFIPTDVSAVAFLPDGDHAVAAGTHVSVYDLGTGRRRTLRASIAACDDLAISKDGTRVVLAQGFATMADATGVEVLALPDGTSIRRVTLEQTRWLYDHAAMSLSADGSTLLVATSVHPEILASEAILVDVVTGSRLRTFNETLARLPGDPGRRISSLALAPDGSSLVIGYREIALY